MFVNSRLCNLHHICIKEQCCTPKIEFLVVSIQPFYLPRGLSGYRDNCVHSPNILCIPTYCNVTIADIAPPSPLSHLWGFQSCQSVIYCPYIHTILNCHSRDNRTLDLFYASTKDAYSSTPLTHWAILITVWPICSLFTCTWCINTHQEVCEEMFRQDQHGTPRLL